MNMNIHQNDHYYLFIKSKTVPNGQAHKGTSIIFIFRSLFSVFRHLFQRSHIFRFKEPTYIIRFKITELRLFLSPWIQSNYNLDKLMNSCLPYPNNTTYMWKNLNIHNFLHHSTNFNLNSLNLSSFIQMKHMMINMNKYINLIHCI